MLFLWLLLLTGGAIEIVTAQEKTSARVVFPKGTASWTVTVTDPGNGVTNSTEEASRRPLTVTRIETLQTPSCRRDLFTWSDGRTSQVWRIADCVLHKGMEGDDIYVGKGEGPPLDSEEVLFTQGTFAWAALTTPEKGRKYNGKPILDFKRETADSGPGEGVLPYEIYADPYTLAPIAFIEGGRLYEFAFGSAPASDLAIPDPFAKALRQIRIASAPMSRFARTGSSRSSY